MHAHVEHNKVWEYLSADLHETRHHNMPANSFETMVGHVPPPRAYQRDDRWISQWLLAMHTRSNLITDDIPLAKASMIVQSTP